MIGTTIDARFRLLAPGGAGAFGTVYRAEDVATGRPVAVKIWSAPTADYARFEREAEVLASLRDPHVVAYVAHGQTDEGVPFIVMDWLEGCDLGDRLSRGPLSAPEALRLVLHAAQGVAAAHAEGIVHRDLKPTNLFLVGNQVDDVRVIDFGLARRTDTHRDLTVTGALLGTPSYMAPEQARGARHLTPAADVFALGCVLYECLTGQHAFAGDTAPAILARILSGEVPRLEGTHVALDELLARMLAPDPLDRFQDGSACALALSAVLASPETTPLSFGRPAISTRAALLVATLFVAVDGVLPPELEARIERFGGRVHHVQTSELLATFELGASAETARRAAQCALDVLQVAPDARAAVTCSRSGTIAASTGAFLAQETLAGVTLARGRAFVDAAGASLLGQSFDTTPEQGGAWLTGYRGVRAGSSDTPFVGRARELATLEGLHTEVEDEYCARLVVIVGAAGIGKSRLVDAALERIRARSPATTILRGYADRPTSASPFELLRGLIQSSLPVLRNDAHRLGMTTTDRGFLDDLIGRRGDEPAVVAARRDLVARADSYRLAWLAFVEGALREGPLVLVLEDIHLGDAASIRLVLAAVKELADERLLVVATSRPDSSQLELFEQHELERVVLEPLRPRVAADLVRARLGGCEPELLDRIVERGGGNPLQLLELTRTKDDISSDLSDMAATGFEAMILRLPPEAQRVVRCASVFGVRFPEDGIAELLEAERKGVALEDLLDIAAAAGILRRGSAAEGSRFAHGLFQEAAYALLSPADCAASHRRAAAWLASRAGTEPSIVAWHYERSDEPKLALDWYTDAARAALVGGASTRAFELTTKAVACFPEGAAPVDVYLLHAEAAFEKGDLSEGTKAAERVLELTTPGSVPWLRAASSLVVSAGQAGNNDRIETIAERVRVHPPDDAGVALHAVTLCRAAGQLAAAGRHANARVLLAAGTAARTDDVIALAARAQVRALFAALEHDYPSAIRFGSESARLYALGANLRTSALLRNLNGGTRILAGDYVGATAELDIAEPLARRTGAEFYVRWARYTRAKIAAFTADPAEACAQLAAVRHELSTVPRIVAGAHIHGALAALRAGDATTAQTEARAAIAAHVELASRSPALAVLARALVLAGRPEEALDAAREAMAIVERLGGLLEHESVVRLAFAETLSAVGDEAGARSAARAAAERLQRIAQFFETGPARDAFLYAIDTHAQTLQLAHRLGTAS